MGKAIIRKLLDPGYSILYILLIFLTCSCNSENQTHHENTVFIAAAADLKFALDSVIVNFNEEYPDLEVSVNYGSSGKFYNQIVNDAPFDIYFSADMNYPQRLVEQGFTAGPINPYAVGRIVLWSRKFSVEDGLSILLSDEIQKVAMANPAHAPYGKRSEEALIYFNIYDSVKSKVVLGENIAQATQFVTSGAAEAGIIALSLAISPSLQKEGNYYLIPEKAHTPLEQAFVVLKKAESKDSVKTFSEFVTSETAKEILKYYGFSVPEAIL
ncbi:molybdate ABC transporter substrate-binding protein [soil metagenome]